MNNNRLRVNNFSDGKSGKPVINPNTAGDDFRKVFPTFK